MRFEETGRLYVSDMDGTLLQTDGTLSPETKSVVQNFIRKGGAFTLCTGRPTGLVLSIAEDLGIRLPVLTYNGAMAFDMQAQQYMHHAVLPDDIAPDLIERVKSYGIDFVLYTLTPAGKTVMVHNKPAHPVLSRFVTDHIRYEHLQERYDPEFGLPKQEHLVQIISINTREVLEKLQKDLLSEFNMKVFVVQCSGDPDYWFLEATSVRSTKGKGVQWLRERMGAREVVCFGDLYNDIPMFQVADTAVAMQNAAHALKEIAHEVTLCNDSHGVARFLEARYFPEKTFSAQEALKT